MKEKKPNMEKMEIKQPVKMAPHWKWLLFTAGVFFPVAIMLFLYNQNAAYIRFDFILAICGIMMLISSAVWWGAYWIFRSPLSSFAVCAIGWTACFSSSYIIMFIQLLYPLKHNGLLCVAAIAALLCLFAALQLRGRGGEGQAELFISVMVGVFLLISGFSSVRTAFAMRSGAFNAGQMPLKTEFVAAKTGANAPNVYWFHCDGMLGFSSMEKYFGDSQNEFLYALKDRGFAVNKTAMLEAGHITWIAIPALMCPYFYDQWLNTRLSSHEKAMQLRSRLLDYGGLLSSARFKNETINAFEAAGYATHTIATVDIYFYPTTDFFYYPSDDAGFVKLERKSIEDKIVQLTDYFQQRDFLIHFIPSLFVLFRYVDYIGISKNGTIMKPILTEEESHQDLLNDDGLYRGSYIANALKYTLTGDMPRFTIVFDVVAHCPFYLSEDGTVIADKSNMDIMSYPAQHRYAAKVLINLIDMILRKDPDAVIVLQGDHGLHSNTEKDFAKYFRNKDCAIDLWNNVMSAIRVPKKFQNGEESYALSNPLNMSRYIVNRFVGRNYEYILKN